MASYQVCTRCVMDTTAADITFDAQGICHYCRDFESRLNAARRTVADHQAHRDEFIATIKAGGQGRDYDCVVGVSGGVDSSYALLLAVRHGLRPLAVHLDNGWNTELATHNIGNLVTQLKVDLYTHVIDWEENRDLQRSLFAAHVVDIEMLMDNAMIALNYQQASKRGVKWILAGTNMATEGMAMPPGWNHFKFDEKNIRGIHARFGTVPIRTHPLMSSLDFVWYRVPAADQVGVVSRLFPVRQVHGAGRAEPRMRIQAVSIQALRIGVHTVLSGAHPPEEIWLRQTSDAPGNPDRQRSDDASGGASPPGAIAVPQPGSGGAGSRCS